MRFIILLAVIGAAYAASPVEPSRIIGGYDTSIALHPHMANVKQRIFGVWAHHVCGGSIINNKYILTSVQCFYNVASSAITVVVGSSLIDGDGGTSHDIATSFAHPSFNARTLENDIGLLSVATIIDLTSALVRAIDIAGSTYLLPSNTEIYALGWGTGTMSGSSNEQMQKVDYYTIANDLCKELYANTNYPIIADNMLCCGYLEGSKKGICDGDVGGPVVHDSVVIGVLSWGSHCNADSIDNPDVTSSVAHFSAWIIANAV